jgi:hypothetical protein
MLPLSAGDTPTLNDYAPHFLRDVCQLVPDIPRTTVSADAFLLQIVLCRSFDVIKRFAKYIFDIFPIYATRDELKLAEYLFNALG